MTLRELSKDVVLSHLAGFVDGPCARVREILSDDPRSSFAVTDSPAASLRESLEIKYRIAKRGGRIIIGDAELLLALGDLGEELVTGVFCNFGNEHAGVYLRSSTLTPVGCIIVSR